MRTGITKGNILKNTGTGIYFLVSLKSDIKKGLAFSITVEYPETGQKTSKTIKKISQPFFITAKQRLT